MSTQTIAARDVEFYRMCVENHTTDLRRCATNDESRHVARRDAAKAVVAALEAYNLAQGLTEDGEQRDYL
jgi:hypothetical protein